MAIKLGFPIKITGSRLVDYIGWEEGLCAFIIILFADENPSKHTIRHQMIHYYQWKEMLIFPFIFTYLAFLICSYVLYNGDIDKAYRTNPFEIEADFNERDKNYLKNRKYFAWIKYIGKEIPDYDEDDDSIIFHSDNESDYSK